MFCQSKSERNNWRSMSLTPRKKIFKDLITSYWGLSDIR